LNETCLESSNKQASGKSIIRLYKNEKAA